MFAPPTNYDDSSRISASAVHDMKLDPPVLGSARLIRVRRKGLGLAETLRPDLGALEIFARDEPIGGRLGAGFRQSLVVVCRACLVGVPVDEDISQARADSRLYVRCG